jgi:hypothetical protein
MIGFDERICEALRIARGNNPARLAYHEFRIADVRGDVGRAGKHGLGDDARKRLGATWKSMDIECASNVDHIASGAKRND